MKDGNWVPVRKMARKYLPKNRGYSKLDALFSVQCDADEGKCVSISGYSALWRWSRGRVRRFLKEIGTDIRYPRNTKKVQNQVGQIGGQITDRSEKQNEQIIFCNNNSLPTKTDRSKEKNGQITDRSAATTRKPVNTNPKKTSSSLQPNDASEAYQLSSHLKYRILKNNPKARPKTKTWPAEIDKMIRIDGRTYEEIRAVIDFCQRDPFWQANILSAGKLRKQFDQLSLRMRNGRRPSIGCWITDNNMHAAAEFCCEDSNGDAFGGFAGNDGQLKLLEGHDDP